MDTRRPKCPLVPWLCKRPREMTNGWKPPQALDNIDNYNNVEMQRGLENAWKPFGALDHIQNNKDGELLFNEFDNFMDNKFMRIAYLQQENDNKKIIDIINWRRDAAHHFNG